ncbi:MAG TPA: response regulator [Ruminiclostridium sp.]
MKYIIADPEEQTGIDLKKMLDGYEILAFGGRFTTLEAAENSIHGEPPGVAFIRIGSAKINGFKLASIIRELNPLSKVIFLSSRKEHVVEAFECGAKGFLFVPIITKKIEHLLLRWI